MEKIGGLSCMLTDILQLFQYGFMQRAFVAGIVIAVVAPFIGTFLVARRLSLIADSLAHVSLAGIAIGLLLGINPVIIALVVTIVVAMVIEKLRSERGISGETSLAVFLSGGLAVAVILIALGPGLKVDLFSYLFGSITTVTQTDLLFIVTLGLAVIALLVIFYKELFFIAFDEEVAKASGLPVGKLNFMLMMLTALTVGLAIRIVGALLIGALMVIPVIAAQQVSRNFTQTVMVAILEGFISVVLGLISAYYLNLPAGGTIVAVSLLILISSMLVKTWSSR